MVNKCLRFFYFNFQIRILQNKLVVWGQDVTDVAWPVFPAKQIYNIFEATHCPWSRLLLRFHILEVQSQRTQDDSFPCFWESYCNSESCQHFGWENVINFNIWEQRWNNPNIYCPNPNPIKHLREVLLPYSEKLHERNFCKFGNFTTFPIWRDTYLTTLC